VGGEDFFNILRAALRQKVAEKVQLLRMLPRAFLNTDVSPLFKSFSSVRNLEQVRVLIET